MSGFVDGYKGVSPLVTSIFILAIVISGIVLVMNIGMPTITKAKENSLFTEAKQNLKVLGNAMDTVVYGGKDTSRKINLEVTDGTYLFNNTTDKVVFSYDLNTDLLPVGLCKKTGDLKIKTYGVGRVLDLRFEEGSGNTTEDCSRYNNTGTLKPNETYGPNWTTAKFGKALEFDGSDDYVEVKDEAGLDGMTAISIEAWTNPDTVSPNEQFIVGKDESGGRSYIIWISNDEIKFSVFNSAGNERGIVTDAANLNIDTWYHVVGVLYADDTMKIYVDGKDESVSYLFTNSVDNVQDTNTEVDIGRRSYSGAENYFNGTIDSVRIYDRALSKSAIKTLYQGGRAGRAQKLEITLDPDAVNITERVRFGRGFNQIFLKNTGYANGKTQLEVRRL